MLSGQVAPVDGMPVAVGLCQGRGADLFGSGGHLLRGACCGARLLPPDGKQEGLAAVANVYFAMVKGW